VGCGAAGVAGRKGNDDEGPLWLRAGGRAARLLRVRRAASGLALVGPSLVEPGLPSVEPGHEVAGVETNTVAVLPVTVIGLRRRGGCDRKGNDEEGPLGFWPAVGSGSAGVTVGRVGSAVGRGRRATIGPGEVAGLGSEKRV